MFSYFAYGLGIHCALPLPELMPAQVPCDVAIHVEPGGYVSPEVSREPWYLKVTLEEAILSLRDVGVFVVRGGREICVIPAPGVDERRIRVYITGTLMALLLYQRGLFVLHASAVDVEGGAVAFLGETGWGKSSMAAAMHARGHAVISDDVTPVQIETEPMTVLPGFPQLKLDPEAAATLGYAHERLHVLHALEEKRGCRVVDGFSHTALPLKRIYILGEDQQQKFELLQPQAALFELVRHSYPTRLEQPGGSRHFVQCADLAKTLQFYRLKRPRSLPSLPLLAGLVEEHIACTAQLVAG